MMENAFHFTLKVLSVLEIYKFLFRLISHVGKQLDRKAKVILLIYDVTNGKVNNYNTYIARYLKK